MILECNSCEILTEFVQKQGCFVCNVCNFSKIIRVNDNDKEYFSICYFNNNSINMKDSKKINKELHYKDEIRTFINDIKNESR